MKQLTECLFAKTNQDSAIFHMRENSKMFDITSKHNGIFNNVPLASWVVNIFLHVILVPIIVP